MIKITAKNDYGEKETFEKWNGKFYDESDLDQIINDGAVKAREIAQPVIKEVYENIGFLTKSF